MTFLRILKPTTVKESKSNFPNIFSFFGGVFCRKTMRTIDCRMSFIALMNDSESYPPLLWFFQDLFAERVFKVIDTDGTGCISQTEFVQTMSQLSAAEDTDNKVMLLFRIYDITDDGKLSSFEIEEVMQVKGSVDNVLLRNIFKKRQGFLPSYNMKFGVDLAFKDGKYQVDERVLEKNLFELCVKMLKWFLLFFQECLSKSGITLPANDVHDLALSIIKEGKKKEEGEEEEEEEEDDDIGEDEIDVDQLKRAFQKHPELLDNLSFM